jgi:CDP-paratose 2-epimerase
MKVLVTGGAGFLGSHVCQLFLTRGWKVEAFDNMSKFELMRTGYNVEKARDYNSNLLKKLDIQLQIADVRNYDTLLECATHCDYIIHTAAQPAMTIALEDPKFDFDNNALGALNVLEVGRKLDIPVALCSTIHVYGNGDNISLQQLLNTKKYYAESDPVLTGRITPLHVSKHIDELYGRAYMESYNSKVAVFRLTGFYGPRQLGGEDHGWVANFAIRTVLDLPIKIFGTDKQVRDILYVTDVAQAFFKWYENGQPSGLYNICGGQECVTSLGNCLKILSDITDKKQDISLEPSRLGDLWYFVGDYSKAERAFKWQPNIMPRDGIQSLVEWIEKNKGLFSK